MIKIIMGVKGSGKTKMIIDMANKAAENAQGIVTVVEKGDKLRYDITYKARLVNTDEFAIGVDGYDRFIGFLAGIAATNYDITDVFIDSIYKIVGDNDIQHFEKFLGDLEKLIEHTKINFVMTVSEDIDNAGALTKKYLA